MAQSCFRVFTAHLPVAGVSQSACSEKKHEKHDKGGLHRGGFGVQEVVLLPWEAVGCC